MRRSLWTKILVYNTWSAIYKCVRRWNRRSPRGRLADSPARKRSAQRQLNLPPGLDSAQIVGRAISARSRLSVGPGRLKKAAAAKIGRPTICASSRATWCGMRKPDPDLFLAAAERLGVPFPPDLLTHLNDLGILRAD